MSKIIREFLDSEGLTLETVKIIKINPISGKEEKVIPTMEFLQSLVNRSRSKRRRKVSDFIPSNYTIPDEKLHIPVTKEAFRIGMKKRLNFGIELSELYDLENITSVINELDFLILRIAVVMNGYENGIKFDSKFMMLYNMAKELNIPVGAYLYIYSPWNFDCNKIVDMMKENNITLDYPLCIDYAEDILITDEVKSKVAEINEILDNSNITHCVYTTSDKSLLQGSMTISFLQETLTEKYIIPSKALDGLFNFETGKGKDVMRAYIVDGKYVYLMALK